MTPFRAALLSRRVPLSEVQRGRAYVLCARNGGVGVAEPEFPGPHEPLGYTLRREKFGTVRLDHELDWEEDTLHGTAIPLRLLDEPPPAERGAWVAWLAAKEVEVRNEVEAAWAVVEAEIERERTRRRGKKKVDSR